MSEQVRFVHGDACATGLPDGAADFVWGEDAWCYVFDKAQLISEAVRVVKSGGTIAFTDWISGTVPMTADESGRFLRFMSFPNVQDVEGYRALLEGAGCTVMTAEDTGRFAPYVDLYLEMIDKQLTYDALRILDFNAGARLPIRLSLQSRPSTMARRRGPEFWMTRPHMADGSWSPSTKSQEVIAQRDPLISGRRANSMSRRASGSLTPLKQAISISSRRRMPPKPSLRTPAGEDDAKPETYRGSLKRQVSSSDLY